MDSSSTEGTTDQSGQAMPILVVIGPGIVTVLRHEIVSGANTIANTAIRLKKIVKFQI